MVQMKILSHPTDLMVDMGAEHSVVTQPVGPLSNKHAIIIGATGDQVLCPLLMARQCNLGSHEVRHEFLYLPKCSVGLLGRKWVLGLLHPYIYAQLHHQSAGCC
jgi:hypothetical protein